MSKVLDLLKESGAFLEGHFLLSSGKHSNGYVQCAKLLQDPKKAEVVVSVIAEKLKDVDFDLVCGPAIGGIVVGYELGRQVKKDAIFTERKEGKMILRRGFEIKPGQKVMIAEDVVTTGKSSLETKEVLEELGAEVVGIACVVNRTKKENVGLPLYWAEKIDLDVFEEENVPEWLLELPVEKPGSRKLKN